jgi:lipoate---protein ligase
MSAILRVVDTGLRPARWNIAMTAALAELHGAGEIRDTLRFQRFEPCVLIGRNQEVTHAARLDRCRARGVALARRLTGGGAVYMDAGALSWQIVADRRRFGADLSDAAQNICAAIVRGLAACGISARFAPPNALEAEGRKLCGASGYFEGATLIYEGTVLVAFDVRAMAEVLGLDRAALAKRLTSVADILGAMPCIEELQRALAASICPCLDVEPLSAGEWMLAEKLHAAEFGTDGFVFGDEIAAAPMRIGA